MRCLFELLRLSELPQYRPDSSSSRPSTVSSRFLQRTNSYRTLWTPLISQMLFGLHYQSIFYSDRLLSKSPLDFLLSRSTLLRTSFGLRQRPGFSSSRTSTVSKFLLRTSIASRLHPSFYDKQSPSGLLQQSISIRASIVSDLLPDSYKIWTLFELLQWMDFRRTSTVDGLQ